MDDPQIGRFWSVDPKADSFRYNSVYAFSEDKVTSHVELEGLEALPIADYNTDFQTSFIPTNKTKVPIFGSPTVTNNIETSHQVTTDNPFFKVERGTYVGNTIGSGGIVNFEATTKDLKPTDAGINVAGMHAGFGLDHVYFGSSNNGEAMNFQMGANKEGITLGMDLSATGSNGNGGGSTLNLTVKPSTFMVAAVVMGGIVAPEVTIPAIRTILPRLIPILTQ
jgi:hypothetical protein